VVFSLRRWERLIHWEFELKHKELWHRFGRSYPHRNTILGRTFVQLRALGYFYTGPNRVFRKSYFLLKLSLKKEQTIFHGLLFY